MKNTKHLILSVFGLALMMWLLGSCTSTKMATHDPYSYQKTKEIKARTSRLMDKASEPFDGHRQEAESLLSEVDEMVTYEKNRPNNEISNEMWQLLADENRFLLAGFIKKWKENERFSKAFLQEAKSQIIDAMDALLSFEEKKDAKTKESLQRVIRTNQ